MSDQMPHDDDLRRLYRELPADEPRAQIDDAILAAARRRGSTAKRQSLIRRLRWTIPMAAAAGVVLTLTLTRLTPERGTSEFDAAPPRAKPELAARSAAPMPPAAPPAAKQSSDAAASAPAPEPPAPPTEDSDAAIAEAPPPALNELKSLGYIIGDEPAAPPATAKPNGSAARARAQDGNEARDDVAAGLARPESAPAAAEMHDVAPVAPSAPTHAPARVAQVAPAAPAMEAQDSAPPAPADDVAAIASVRGAPKKESAVPSARKQEGAGVAIIAGAGKGEADGVPRDPDAADEAGAVAFCEAAPQDPAKAAAAAAADAEYARQLQESLRRWPFGLEPWLEEAEACRRLVAKLDTTCEFRAGVAVVQPAEPEMIDAGPSKGSTVKQLKLTSRNGKLASVELRFQETGSRQMLFAPEPAQ